MRVLLASAGLLFLMIGASFAGATDEEVINRFKNTWRAQDGSSAEMLIQKAKEHSHFTPRGWQVVRRKDGVEMVSLSWARQPADSTEREYTFDWIVKADGTFESALEGDKVVELGWQPFILTLLDDEETYEIPNRNIKFLYDLKNFNFVVTSQGKLGDLLRDGGCSLGDPASLGYVPKTIAISGHWRLQLSTNCKSGPAYFAKDGVVLFEKTGTAPWKPTSFFAKRISSNPVGSWFKNKDPQEDAVLDIARKAAERMRRLQQ